MAKAIKTGIKAALFVAIGIGLGAVFGATGTFKVSFTHGAQSS